jgi:hypothetical protein
MRYYHLIREYSRDKTVENWGGKIAARVEQDRTLRIPGIPPGLFKSLKEPEQITKFVADHIIKPLEQADPTKNKQYVQNLIKFYIAGEQLEDLTSTAVEYLTKFHKLKAKKQIPSPENDINRYTSFDDFANAIDEYPDPEEKQSMPKGEAKEVYKDANVRIIRPEDEEAACYYGQGTRWCTAATKGENLFNQYNQEGPLYILIPTKPQYNGEKYQIAPYSYQYMNEYDEEQDMMDVKERFSSPGFLKWWDDIHASQLMTVGYLIKAYKDKFKSAWTAISDYAEKVINYYLDLGEIDEDEAYGLRKDFIEISEIPPDEILDQLEDNYEQNTHMSDTAYFFIDFDSSGRNWNEKEIYRKIGDKVSNIKLKYDKNTGEIDIKYPPIKDQKAQKVELVGQEDRQEDQLDKEIDQLNKNALSYLARQKVDNVP